MGVNAQKRKKKQGPVPTLEESLPKKFKKDTTAKSKKREDGAKANGKEKPAKRKIAVKEVAEEKVEEFPDEPQDFGATKASLFDDDDDEYGGGEEAGDEVNGMDDERMWFPRDTPDSVTNLCRDADFESSDDEENQERNAFSDSSDEEELTAANMEALSAKLDSFAREDIRAAQDELLNPSQPAAEGVLTTSKETNEDLSSVKTRIMEIARVLGDFKTLREEGVKRKDYIDRLVDDIASYYSYNTYLARKFLEMFSVAEVLPPTSLYTDIRRSNFLKLTKSPAPSSSAQTLSKQPEENSLTPSPPAA